MVIDNTVGPSSRIPRHLSYKVGSSLQLSYPFTYIILITNFSFVHFKARPLDGAYTGCLLLSETLLFYFKIKLFNTEAKH